MGNGKFKEVRCQYVPTQTADELYNIAKNLGLNISTFMKPHLKTIADSYSAELKKPKNKD